MKLILLCNLSNPEASEWNIFFLLSITSSYIHLLSLLINSRAYRYKLIVFKSNSHNNNGKLDLFMKICKAHFQLFDFCLFPSRTSTQFRTLLQIQWQSISLSVISRFEQWSVYGAKNQSKGSQQGGSWSIFCAFLTCDSNFYKQASWKYKVLYRNISYLYMLDL